MKITWYGHSAFRLDFDGKAVLIDPFFTGNPAFVSDKAAAIEGVRMAFEIELGGRAFYQRAAADTTDPVLCTLFSRFAVMEGEHMETLSRRFHVEPPAPSPELRLQAAMV